MSKITVTRPHKMAVYETVKSQEYMCGARVISPGGVNNAVVFKSEVKVTRPCKAKMQNGLLLEKGKA